MIVDCPKCGFSQPKDKYCANCGIDIEQFQKRPDGLVTRALNNPNLHLGLIIALILGTVFYLFVLQRDVISKEVQRIMTGLPILSQNSSEDTPVADFDAKIEKSSRAEAQKAPAENFIAPSAATKQDPKVAGPPNVEVRYVEVSKENMRALAAVSQQVRELQDWRVLFIPDANNIQSVMSSARTLPGSVKRALPTNGELEILSGDFDPDPQTPFLGFSMIWTMPNAVTWSLISQLPNPDPQGRPKLLQSEQEGEMAWDPKGALLIVFDPLQRIPVQEGTPLDRSPLQVLQSSDFKSGYSELVIWIEITNKPAMF